MALCSPTQPSPAMKVVGLDLVNILSEFCIEILAPHESGLLQVKNVGGGGQGGRGRGGWISSFRRIQAPLEEVPICVLIACGIAAWLATETY